METSLKTIALRVIALATTSFGAQLKLSQTQFKLRHTLFKLCPAQFKTFKLYRAQFVVLSCSNKPRCGKFVLATLR